MPRPAGLPDRKIGNGVAMLRSQPKKEGIMVKEWTNRRVCVLLLIGVLGLAGAGSREPAAARASAAAASPVSLIYAGWFGSTIPTPAFIRANKAFLETQPFHGIIAYLRDDSTGVNATTGIMGGGLMGPGAIEAVIAPLKGLGLTTL